MLVTKAVVMVVVMEFATKAVVMVVVTEFETKAVMYVSDEGCCDGGSDRVRDES